MTLWCKVYKAKYLKNKSLLDPAYNKHTGCSSTWNSIISGAKLLRHGLVWRVGNGRSIKFWTDDWTGLGPLSSLTINPGIVDNNNLIQDFFSQSSWDIDKLSLYLPDQVIDHITAIPISTSNEIEDRLIWKATSNGKFTVSSAYSCSINFDSSLDCFWKGIWAFKIPPKLKLFAWTMVQGRLLTNSQRCKRNFTTDPNCKFCPGILESMLHLLRDCPRATAIWNAIHIPLRIQGTFHLDWNGWILANTL